MNFGVTHKKQQELETRMARMGINEQDLEEKFVRSSGPGGQKTNKSSTCVYLKHAPTSIEVKSQRTRSRALNRYYARKRLCGLMEAKKLGKKSPEALKAVKNEILLIGDLILIEVLQGFHRERDFREASELLMRFPIAELVGTEVALQSAKNYRYLRKRGITIRKTVDIIIGTFCINNELPLLHNDRDFSPLERHLGLKIVDV